MKTFPVCESRANGQPGFFRRRLVDPVRSLLKQGMGAEVLARTLALGTVLSIFPFLGTTTLLVLVVGWWRKMNQPILQTLNQLLGPIQLAMIFVYVRLGEWIWRDAGNRFSVGEMIGVFRDVSFHEFLQRFGWAGIHAFTAWALTAPFLFVALYFAARPVMMKLAREIGRKGGDQ